MQKHLKLISEGLLHLLYPQLCLGCNVPLKGNEELLCLECAIKIPETGFHHILENDAWKRFVGRVSIERATSLAHFTNEGLLQVLIHALKYSSNKKVGIYLGELLGRRLLKAGWDVDVVIPVPLHKKKEAKRGYNQSLYIATGICNVTNWELDNKHLVRTKETESQTQKSRKARVDNMKGAFEVLPANYANTTKFLLIDDVLTTGSTLEACVLALNRHNYSKISIATIGIAVS